MVPSTVMDLRFEYALGIDRSRDAREAGGISEPIVAGPSSALRRLTGTEARDSVALQGVADIKRKFSIHTQDFHRAVDRINVNDADGTGC
jgi:hypothetical protein